MADRRSGERLPRVGSVPLPFVERATQVAPRRRQPTFRGTSTSSSARSPLGDPLNKDARMTDELDPNKLVVGFLNSNVDKIAGALASAMKGTRNAIRARIFKTYRAYLTRMLDRHSNSKSFFVRSEPLPIYDFFVPPDLSTTQRTLTKPGVAEVAAMAPAAIIVGSGGCGKTMLMRHLLVSCLQGTTKTPVFLELRQLNGNEESLRSALLNVLNSNALDVDDKYLDIALSAGHFCILLDGFDELELTGSIRVSQR